MSDEWLESVLEGKHPFLQNINGEIQDRFKIDPDIEKVISGCPFVPSSCKKSIGEVRQYIILIEELLWVQQGLPKGIAHVFGIRDKNLINLIGDIYNSVVYRDTEDDLRLIIKLSHVVKVAGNRTGIGSQ